MSHNSLHNYYSSIFSMAQHHKYSIDEIERLMPFERDIYVEMLAAFIRKQEEMQERLAQKR